MQKKPLSLTSPTQRQGGYFEQMASQYLQDQGLILIAQNWQQPKVGELDLVMLQHGMAWDTLIFVEVRQRKSSAFADALMSVTAAKQRKIIKAARYFLQQHPEYDQCECRFDVLAYENSSLLPEWVQSAFMT
ncbi:YraN family protein [Psychrobacter sp. I-STPA10]|uniref:YraN family protein n=1 Tax=Psychrobacter sp. I-STPA10 TaxID=2585769 RepID=UPI001E3E0A47|nr:YraN family protein [Psychrobacter sp. I-STPA10]